MELIIDSEFKELLPTLKDDERNRLEEDIKKNGVLNPLIVWKNCLIDGHNRYEICKANNIPFTTREINFSDRDDVKVWILKHQLGRRNLSDFDRNRIALRYEEVIAKQMKQRLSDMGRIGADITNGVRSNEHTPIEGTTRRREIAKIAGTNESSVQRTKYILEKGTPEQIDRASRGGKEPDGRSNSISSIEKEIKDGLDIKTYRCYNCGRILPASSFYFKKNGQCNYECKECSKIRSKPKKYKDFKGNNIKSANILMTEEDLKNYLYNQDKEIDYTMEDLLEEMKSNGEKGIRTVETTILIHKELLESEENKQKAMELISTLLDRLNQLNQLIKE